ncbi:hypothetical protein VNO78_23214 [Psophocarpus tetragonolobus]|uniref:Uncharacterized protein n=1 Tax=Psophocarpus tetragonolobus TaxID=3891 RepID=A0AAN9S6B4_PSOTE
MPKDWKVNQSYRFTYTLLQVSIYSTLQENADSQAVQSLKKFILVVRLFILTLFLQYRILHPVIDAHGTALWLTSVICEIWLTLSMDN